VLDLESERRFARRHAKGYGWQMAIRPRSATCALAIAGLDPGGGAGIAADLRAFAAAGVFGSAAVTLVTVQSTVGARAVRVLPARLVRAQIEEVLRNQRVRAIKIGALGSRENVLAVARILRGCRGTPCVVDTPIAATRGGARLLTEPALKALREHLLPRATLVTANVDEMQALVGVRVRSVAEARDAARVLVASGVRAALVKGGHLEGPNAIDVMVIDDDVIELRARRLPTPEIHGTGCTFASLIAGRLARRRTARATLDGRALVDAVRWAKRVHHASLRAALNVGKGMRVLGF
jgi:hydroxymethylpyrimidine/phosphomethylpyrimidine kinase